MRRLVLLLSAIVISILSGCYRQVTTVEIVPINLHYESQHYGEFEQVNITKLEGLQEITDSDIYLPIPKGAQWDGETKTYILSDNYVNENGESFIMTISLESIPENVTFTGKIVEIQEEIDNYKEGDDAGMGSFGMVTGSSVVSKDVRYIECEEAVDGKETTIYNIEIYDFFESVVLQVEVEMVKQKGTINSSIDTYINALGNTVAQIDKN